MSCLTSQCCLYQQDALFSFKSQGDVDLLCLCVLYTLQSRINLCFKSRTVLLKLLSSLLQSPCKSCKQLKYHSQEGPS